MSTKKNWIEMFCTVTMEKYEIEIVFYISGQTTSISCLLCCFAVVCGFFLGVDQENLSGIICLY